MARSTRRPTFGVYGVATATHVGAELPYDKLIPLASSKVSCSKVRFAKYKKRNFAKIQNTHLE